MLYPLLFPRCSHCNLPIEIANTIPTTIISKDVTSKAAPLIVGENIKRYSIGSNRWILTNRKGIKYKEKLFMKILK